VLARRRPTAFRGIGFSSAAGSTDVVTGKRGGAAKIRGWRRGGCSEDVAPLDVATADSSAPSRRPGLNSSSAAWRARSTFSRLFRSPIEFHSLTERFSPEKRLVSPEYKIDRKICKADFLGRERSKIRFASDFIDEREADSYTKVGSRLGLMAAA
jgi:hypothetical protein